MTCECGKKFDDCEFWQAVLTEAYGSERELVRTEVRARSQGLWRHSVLPALSRSRSPLSPNVALDEIGALVEPVYRAAEKVSGSTHIVDATKASLWGLALSGVPAIDLRVVHLVRDPVAYLDSDGRSRPVPYPPGAMRPPRPAGRSLITWLLLHLEADVLAHRDLSSITVLYEDLVRAPGRDGRAGGPCDRSRCRCRWDLRRRCAGGRSPRPCDRRQPASAAPGADPDRASGAPRPGTGDAPLRPTDPVAGRAGSLPGLCGISPSFPI